MIHAEESGKREGEYKMEIKQIEYQEKKID